MDGGQVNREDQAVEVEIGFVPVAASAVQDAEGEAPPGFGVDGVSEEIPAREGLAVKRYRERVVPGRVLERAPDDLAGFFRTEADRSPVGPGRILIGEDACFFFPQEMGGREIDAPAGDGARPRRDRAAAARQAQKPHPGRVLAPYQFPAPAVLAEGEEHGGVGDPGPVVGDGDGLRAGRLMGGDVEARRSARGCSAAPR